MLIGLAAAAAVYHAGASFPSLVRVAAVDAAWAVVAQPQDRYVVIIATQSRGAGSTDVWLIQLDDSGEKTWERLYGEALRDRPTSGALPSDGGLYVAGYTTFRGAGYEDFWVLRLDARGTLSIP